MRALFLTICALAASLVKVQAALIPALERSCTQNACLNFAATYHKKGDCDQFFVETVIPAAVTSKSTTIIIATKTRKVVKTSVIYDTTDYASTVYASVSTSFTSTSTSTSTYAIDTVTTTFLGDRKLAKRIQAQAITNSTTTLPPPASSVCKNVAQYSSACSCVGATHRTITQATPTKSEVVIKHETTVKRVTSKKSVTFASHDPGTTTSSTATTITTYATATITETTSETDVVFEEFIVQVSSSNPARDGQYVFLENPQFHNSFANITSQVTAATVFSLNGNGQWHSNNGHFALTGAASDPPPKESGYEQLYFFDQSHDMSNYLICSADEYTGAFTCHNDLGQDRIFSICDIGFGALLYFGDRLPPDCISVDELTFTALFNGDRGNPSSSGYGSSYSSSNN